MFLVQLIITSDIHIIGLLFYLIVIFQSNPNKSIQNKDERYLSHH